MRQKARMTSRIEEIKRIWQPGMTASMVAAAVSGEVFAKDNVELLKQGHYPQPTRNVIVGIFERHGKKLAPCRLAGYTKPVSKLLPKVQSVPRVKHAPKLVPKPTPVVQVKVNKKKQAEEVPTAEPAFDRAELSGRRFDLDRKVFKGGESEEQKVTRSRITVATRDNPILRKFFSED